MDPRRRVLVVDDDAVIRLQVDRQLEELGWEVLTVNTGSEAIRVVELGMVCHVMLTEARLPDLDGDSAAWLVARMLPGIRVAFMGTSAPDRPLKPAHAPFLLKPFSTMALAKALAGAAAYPR
jgi:CheY-like chemotaxis protein